MNHVDLQRHIEEARRRNTVQHLDQHPDDPYFKKLEYSLYHGGVHKTATIMKKLQPYESRKFTQQHAMNDFLDQE